MRLIMTLLVRDEAQIIRDNIDYHLSQGVDFIIATDNLSTDSTPDILKEYQRKGVLHYIHESNDDYSQDLWVTRMAVIAAQQYDADWIIHNDADEFWWPENGKTLKHVFEAVLPKTDGLIIERTNFITTKKYNNNLPVYTQLKYRYRESVNALGKRLPSKVCHLALDNVYVHQGNHNISLPGRSLNIKKSDDIVIFHFPYRDFEGFQSKILLGGTAYQANTRLPKGVGRTWRELYKLACSGNLKDYYASLTLSDNQISAMLDKGTAIYDPRLSQYIESHLPRQWLLSKKSCE